MINNYIPLSECKHGYIYKIHSRNLSTAVFNSKNNGFIGIRLKFNDEFLFTEFHWDTGPPFGTVKPKELLHKLPENIELKEILGSIDKKSKRLVEFKETEGWYYIDSNEFDKNIDPVSLHNEKLFEYLQTCLRLKLSLDKIR